MSGTTSRREFLRRMAIAAGAASWPLGQPALAAGLSDPPSSSPPGEPQVVLPADQETLGVAEVNLALSANWDRYRQRLDPKWQS